jgi:hypothetical protein
MLTASGRRLRDLVVVVVAGAEHRHVAGDAALAEGDVLRAVERVILAVGGVLRLARLGLGGLGRQLAARRVGDQRGAVLEPPADDPERVVIAGRRVARREALLLAEDVVQGRDVDRIAEGRVAVAVEQLAGGGRQVLHFGVGQRGATRELVGALERGGGVVFPDAGDVGVAVGGARRHVFGFRGGRLRGERRSRQ